MEHKNAVLDSWGLDPRRRGVRSPVEKVTLSAQVADYLREAIMKGRLAPDERIPQEEVAQLRKGANA